MTTVRQLPETKKQIETFAHQLEQGLVKGDIIPTDLLRFQKAMEKVFEKIKPILIESAIVEVEHYEKNPVIKGAEYSIIEAGVKYDYSGCNDLEYNMLNIQLECLKSTIKDRETFLKAIKAPMQMIDETSGEVYTINPPKKSSSTTLKVTFK